MSTIKIDGFTCSYEKIVHQVDQKQVAGASKNSCLPRGNPDVSGICGPAPVALCDMKHA